MTFEFNEDLHHSKGFFGGGGGGVLMIRGSFICFLDMTRLNLLFIRKYVRGLKSFFFSQFLFFRGRADMGAGELVSSPLNLTGGRNL